DSTQIELVVCGSSIFIIVVLCLPKFPITHVVIWELQKEEEEFFFSEIARMPESLSCLWCIKDEHLRRLRCMGVQNYMLFTQLDRKELVVYDMRNGSWSSHCSVLQAVTSLSLKSRSD
ncbi:hypothetical protein KI387_024598, partial [Taxus chinensis]